MAQDDYLVIASACSPERPRYRRDLLSCFCYPVGTHFRFSYRKKWIEQGVLDAYEQIKGRRALILFCDTPEDPKTQNFRFVPLRHATVECLEPADLVRRADDNTYLAIRFTLGPFVNYAPPNTAMYMMSWQEWVSEKGGGFYPRPMGHFDEKAKSRFLFQCSSSYFEEGRDVKQLTAWLSLADELSKAKSLEGASFYRLGEVRELKKKNGELVKTTSFAERGAWVFEAGRTYSIGLHYYLDPDSANLPKTLATKSSTESIVLSDPIINSIGMSTDAQVVARCSRVYTEETAVLVIEDSEDKSGNVPRVEMPIILKPARWLPFVVVALALGSLLTGVSQETLKQLAAAGGAFAWLAGNEAVVAWLIKAIGTALVGVGAFYGFRKVPSAG